MAGGRRTIARLVGAALLAVLLVAGCSALAPQAPEPTAAPTTAAPRLPAAPTKRPGPLLAGVGDTAGELVRLDPRSLRPLAGRRLRLPGNVAAYAYAPDRSTLALADNQRATLYLVDVARLWLLGEVPLPAASAPWWLGWLGPRRLAAVVDDGNGQVQLLLVDPAARRVLAARRLHGTLSGAAPGDGVAALLLTPAGTIGPASLAVADAGGTVRTVALPWIVAGFEPPAEEGPDAVGRQRVAALAVDAAGGRAFVVGAEMPLVTVDLASLRATARDLPSSGGVLRRLARWLLPPAEAKLLQGPSRQACWLGNGLLAVWGSDSRVVKDAAGRPQNLITRAACG
jgi:hypothetical protein